MRLLRPIATECLMHLIVSVVKPTRRSVSIGSTSRDFIHQFDAIYPWDHVGLRKSLKTCPWQLHRLHLNLLYPHAHMRTRHRADARQLTQSCTRVGISYPRLEGKGLGKYIDHNGVLLLTGKIVNILLYGRPWGTFRKFQSNTNVLCTSHYPMCIQNYISSYRRIAKYANFENKYNVLVLQSRG